MGVHFVELFSLYILILDLFKDHFYPHMFQEEFIATTVQCSATKKAIKTKMLLKENGVNKVAANYDVTEKKYKTVLQRLHYI